MSTIAWQPPLAVRPEERGSDPVRRLSFMRDERGIVAPIFAMLVIPMMLLIGLSVDLGRYVQARNQAQLAVDAMALAAGRAAQMKPGSPDLAAQEAANAYFQATKPGNVIGAQFSIVPKNGSSEFDIVLTGWLRTPFMSVANIGGNQSSSSQATSAGCPAGNGFACLKVEAKATSTLASGGNNGSNIEVVMMLDITGSMGPGYGDGKKLDDLKVAAKDAVDILVWQDQSKYQSRISLAPFSQRVNAGSYAAAVTGLPATKTTTTVISRTCRRNSNGNITVRTGNCNNNETEISQQTSSTTQYLVTCVTERTGSHAYKDDAPGSSRWIGAFANNSTWNSSHAGSNDASNTSNYTSSATGDCGGSDPSSTEKIVPLTKDKDKLKNAINGLTAGGGTAGQLGTAWAWYTLSPKWNSIWPSESSAGSYSDLTSLGQNGAPKLRKIAVLMTDGVYNQQYSSVNSATQAAALCTAMKAEKIEVYTVGFQIDDASAATLLRNCATDVSHYYSASTGESLKMAFRDIALKISTLRLTQ